jgi:hypothetical protein
VAVLQGALVVGCAALLFGAPVWVFMGGSAVEWVDDRPVTAHLRGDLGPGAGRRQRPEAARRPHPDGGSRHAPWATTWR